MQAQTFADWEYIVIDDGSTDETPDVVAGFPNVIRNANRGSGAALNTGIARATGRFVAFLDADDEYLPNHLETHLSLLQSEPGIDLLWGGIELVCDDEYQALVPDVRRGRGLIHARECVVQGTLFVRRRVFESIRFSEDRSVWYYDFDFVRKVETAGFVCRRFDMPTYRYYRNSGHSLVDRAKAATVSLT